MICRRKSHNPYAHLALARNSDPEKAYEVIRCILKIPTSSLEYLFDVNREELPQQIKWFQRYTEDAEIYEELLNLFVSSAEESGHFEDLYVLILPKMKYDGKISKSMLESPVFYGIDRFIVFEKHIDCLLARASNEIIRRNGARRSREVL